MIGDPYGRHRKGLQNPARACIAYNAPRTGKGKRAMTLRISLKDGDRVIVNGAVLRAVGRTSLCVESRAAILRGRDLMAAADATTPARRLYYACITAYTDRENGACHKEAILAALGEVAATMTSPQALASATEFAHRIAKSDLYRALADCRALMALEAGETASQSDHTFA